MAPNLDALEVAEDLLPKDAKALIWDCDGTVIDTMTLHWKAWSATAQKYGLELDLVTYLAYAGTPAKDILADLCLKQGKTVDAIEAVSFKSSFYMALVPQVKAIEQVMPILRAARARGIPCAIASGGARAHVVGGLTATGLLREFDAVVTCEDYAKGKPAPDCFLLAASMLGVDPAACVGYEDADLGMVAICAAGFLKAVDVRLIAGYPHVQG